MRATWMSWLDSLPNRDKAHVVHTLIYFFALSVSILIVAWAPWRSAG